MQPILFSLFDNEVMLNLIQQKCGYEIGEIVFRQFPDQETLVEITSDIKNRKVIFVANLSRPNKKILPLVFAAKTACDLGAKEITLVAPYLVYMRQDKQFNLGEGITSKYFAELISNYFNKLITVDPHLHRYDSLNKIYKIPSVVLHAVDPIAGWIEKNVDNPVIIGPDDLSALITGALVHSENYC